MLYIKKLINFQLVRWLSSWSMRPECRKSHDRCSRLDVRTSSWPLNVRKKQNKNKNKSSSAALETKFLSSELFSRILKPHGLPRTSCFFGNVKSSFLLFYFLSQFLSQRTTLNLPNCIVITLSEHDKTTPNSSGDLTSLIIFLLLKRLQLLFQRKQNAHRVLNFNKWTV